MNRATWLQDRRIRHSPVPPDQGACQGWHHGDRSRECLDPGRLPAGSQCPLCPASGGGGKRLCEGCGPRRAHRNPVRPGGPGGLTAPTRWAGGGGDCESPLRAHFVKARVRVHEYPNGALAVFHGPRCIARYNPQGEQTTAAPTCASNDTVLAAVKAWPVQGRACGKRSATAILDCGCARRHWANAGRDEETTLRSNKEADLKQAGKPGSSCDLSQHQAGRPTLPNRRGHLNPEADN